MMKPVDGSSLALFRILFGCVVTYHVYSYFISYIFSPEYKKYEFFFHFSFYNFLHLKLLPGIYVKPFFYTLLIAACGITIGLYYRLFLSVFLLLFGYIHILAKTPYNSRNYIILLFTFVLLITEGQRYFSINTFRTLKNKKRCIPYWNVFLFKAQVLIIYFSAGIAKLNADWLNGTYARCLLSNKTSTPFLGQYVMEDWFIYFISYGGVLFELSIGFLLWHKKTRWWAIGIGLFFHAFTYYFFKLNNIAIFMLITYVLFLNPDKFRIFLKKLLQKVNPEKFKNIFLYDQQESARLNNKKYRSKAISALVVAYLLIQICIPLRHWFYPGRVDWNRKGDRYSWRIFAQIFRRGSLKFYIRDPQTGEVYIEEDFKNLKKHQKKVMQVRPDMLIQFAHYLGDKYKRKGIQNPIVNVESYLSLNCRPMKLHTDPSVNLIEQDYGLFTSADWILPYPYK